MRFLKYFLLIPAFLSFLTFCDSTPKNNEILCKAFLQELKDHTQQDNFFSVDWYQISNKKDLSGEFIKTVCNVIVDHGSVTGFCSDKVPSRLCTAIEKMRDSLVNLTSADARTIIEMSGIALEQVAKAMVGKVFFTPEDAVQLITETRDDYKLYLIKTGVFHTVEFSMSDLRKVKKMTGTVGSYRTMGKSLVLQLKDRVVSSLIVP